MEEEVEKVEVKVEKVEVKVEKVEVEVEVEQDSDILKVSSTQPILITFINYEHLLIFPTSQKFCILIQTIIIFYTLFNF
jgi:hypothetical protein